MFMFNNFLRILFIQLFGYFNVFLHISRELLSLPHLEKGFLSALLACFGWMGKAHTEDFIIYSLIVAVTCDFFCFLHTNPLLFLHLSIFYSLSCGSRMRRGKTHFLHVSRFSNYFSGKNKRNSDSVFTNINIIFFSFVLCIYCCCLLPTP